MSGVAFTAGVTLLVLIWLSVLRTVFIPHRRSGLLMRMAVRFVRYCGVAIARRMLPGRRARVLDLCGPVALMIVGCCWMAGTFVGTALLAPALTGLTVAPGPMADFMLLRGESRAELVAIGGWLMVVGTLLVYCLHLGRITSAYSRRERVVARLSVQSGSPWEAECLLAEHLRNGARDSLDRFFAQWTEWFADISASHTGYPALICYRSAGELCWLDAAVLVLDAAALTEAVAPAWAPPSARTVLQAGAACMPAVARQIGIDIPRPAVSLQGREERGFENSVRVAVIAGLPEQRGYVAAWSTFQHWRTRYAPQTAAMCVRLLCSQEEDEPAHTGGVDDDVGEPPGTTPTAQDDLLRNRPG